MFEKILYCVGNKTIEINGEDFSLGELTAEVLNLPRNDYFEMKTIIDSAIQKTYKYETSHDLKDWFEANEDFTVLDNMMSKHKIFSLLKEDNNILEEAKQFTSQLYVFDNEDCELSHRDLEILLQIEEYNEYLEHPENFGNCDTVYLDDEKSGLSFPIDIPKLDIPSAPPSKTRALLIYPGNIKAKWKYYKNFCTMYERILYDIQSFNNTIYNFIDFYLSKLQKLNSNNYASALLNFLNHPNAHKLIANPISGTGLFTNSDSVTLRYIPRETSKGSGEFKIYEYYEVQSLQTLLKTDFYKALEAGYIIRRCAYCGRFFMLKKAYHTKYCDKPAPGNPKYTCAQLGYHYKGVKETVADNPKAQSLNRCYKRIDKDLSRHIITAEEREILYAKAKDLYHHAKITPGISNEEFEKSLASKNLYPLCNVIRKTNPRGRPKAKGEHMTNEEMIQKYYDGDENILEKLYNENIGFIHSIAKESAAAFNCFHKKENRPQELTVYTKEILSDLDSEGVLAFFDCIQSRKYDVTKAKLTTYLYPHIKGAMYRWLEKNVGAVSLSKHDMNTIRKVQKMYYEDYKEVAEIADELKLSETTVEKYINYNTHSLSVEDIAPDNSDSFIEYLLLEETSISTDKLIQQKLCLELLEKQFNNLPDKDKYILGHSMGGIRIQKENS